MLSSLILINRLSCGHGAEFVVCENSTGGEGRLMVDAEPDEDRPRAGSLEQVGPLVLWARGTVVESRIISGAFRKGEC